MHVSSHGQMYRFGCPYVYSKRRGSDNPDRNLDGSEGVTSDLSGRDLSHPLSYL